jgi:hypothetical protein
MESLKKSFSELTRPQFFIADWVATYGYTATFVVHGIIIICIAVPGILLLHKFGARIRKRSGAPSWVNPEYDAL